jgi:hypothetical protein
MVIAEMMAAASLVALVPLYVSYCASLLSAARTMQISERVAALTGARDGQLEAHDFERVLQLVRLCPDYDEGSTGVRAVTAYYRALDVSGRLVGGFSPKLAAWTEQERRNCAHFAAVVLCRCISSSRSLLAQHAGE